MACAGGDNCCSDDGPIPEACRTDSAGIEVATSFEAKWQDGEAWSLQHPPVIDIGAEDGPEEAHLFGVRDAMLWDESLVVLNGGTEDIRFFDLQGQLRTILGREGAGPGEFDNLGFVRVKGDSLVTWDFGNDRVSVFDKEGNLVRTYRLDRPDGFDGLFGPVDLLESGDLLTSAKQYHMVQMEGRSVVWTDSAVIALHDPEGNLRRTNGLLPAGQRMRFMSSSGLIVTLPAPFASSLVTATWDDGYCAGFGDRFEIRCYSTAGAVRRIVRARALTQKITNGDMRRYVEQRTAGRGAAASYFREIADDVEPPETFPAFVELKIDESGNMWVEAYRLSEETPSRWLVFDQGGCLQGAVEMPRRFELLQVYERLIVGVWRDSLDVEHVRVHELIK